MTPPITSIIESESHFEFKPIGYFIDEYVRKDNDFGILGKFTNAKNQKEFYEFLDKLDSFHEKLFKSVNKFAENNDMPIDELIDKYSKDVDFLNYLNSIKISLNELSNVMEKIDFEYDEYYNFKSINKMINYIVSDIEKYFKYYSFMLLILTAFKDFIGKERESIDYREEYENFDIFLYNQEDFFLY